MELPDIPRYTEIYVFCWRDAYKGIFPNEYKAMLTMCACKDDDKHESFELLAIYVDPFFQKQGIGASFVEFCEQKAVEYRYREVCIWAFEANTKARAFYEKMGYSSGGATRAVGRFAIAEVR